MNPMSTFDPDQESRVHDALSDEVFIWQSSWGDIWRQYAFPDEAAGCVYLAGRILDAWEPVVPAASPKDCSELVTQEVVLPPGEAGPLDDDLRPRPVHAP
jgi:hypothetical protein